MNVLTEEMMLCRRNIHVGDHKGAGIQGAVCKAHPRNLLIPHEDLFYPISAYNPDSHIKSQGLDALY